MSYPESRSISAFCLCRALILSLSFLNVIGYVGVASAQPPPSPIVSEITSEVESAFKLYLNGEYEKALSLATQLQERAPKDPRPLHVIGAAYYGQKKYNEASEAFGRSMTLDPTRKPIYLAKAHVDALRGEIDTALASLRKAIDIYPTFALAHEMLGDFLRADAKSRAEAILAYRTALSIDPSLKGVYPKLALALQLSGDEEGYSEVARKIMEDDPKKMDRRFDLGRSLVKQGKLKEARELWESRGEGKDNTFPNFITVLERAEKLKTATEAYNAKPENPDTLLAYGYAVMDGDHWVVDGRQKKAIVHFRKALEIRPDFTQAQYAICKAFVQIADTYRSANVELDKELSTLRKMDSKLAADIDEYRKTYKGGFRGIPAPKPKSR